VLGEDEQLHLRVGEDACSKEQFIERRAWFRFRAFPARGLVDELGQFGDFLAQGDRVNVGTTSSSCCDDLLLLLVGQVLEVIGQLRFICSWR
jgi:hypothetical protein